MIFWYRKKLTVVRRILNGTMLQEPLLDLNVANKFDRGLLGIAVSRSQEKRDTEIHFSSKPFEPFSQP
jgi:hypothetical protein